METTTDQSSVLGTPQVPVATEIAGELGSAGNPSSLPQESSVQLDTAVEAGGVSLSQKWRELISSGFLQEILSNEAIAGVNEILRRIESGTPVVEADVDPNVLALLSPALKAKLQPSAGHEADFSTHVTDKKMSEPTPLSSDQIPAELISKAPDITTADGDVWFEQGMEERGGSTSKVRTAIFKRRSDGGVYTAIVKTMDPKQSRSFQYKKPEQMLAEAEVLKLGIPGLPTYFTSGFGSHGEVQTAILPDQYPQPTILVMERMPVDSLGYVETDQLQAYSYLYKSKEYPEQQPLGGPIHTEAVALASFYYYVFVAAEVNRNGWSFPDFDVQMTKYDSIAYDDKEGKFHALDFGMAEPITQENAKLLVDKIGGQEFFNTLRRKNIYGDSDNGKFDLEYRLEKGKKASELSTFSWGDYRAGFLYQIRELIGKRVPYRSEIQWREFTEGIMGDEGSPTARLGSFLEAVCIDPQSSNGWIGLESAFRNVLQKSMVIDDDLRAEISKVLMQTGISMI